VWPLQNADRCRSDGFPSRHLRSAVLGATFHQFRTAGHQCSSSPVTHDPNHVIDAMIQWNTISLKPASFKNEQSVVTGFRDRCAENCIDQDSQKVSI
jgi:hypothetical protein